VVIPDAKASSQRIVVSAAEARERLDRLLVTHFPEHSRAEIQRWIDAGSVLVDGAVATSRTKVKEGSRIEATPLPPATTDAKPEAIPLSILFEDEHLLVVDKPAGLVVHPGSGNLDGTLVQGLLARYPELATVGDPHRPGIVHRLDKGTSGLLLVARSPAAYTALVAQLKAHEVERRYLALAWGELDSLSGLIDAPIGRSIREPTRMTVSAQGKPARTRYDVVATYRDPVVVSLLECRLETGRTHQIRVHLTSIGHAVVGDPTYGRRSEVLGLDRPFLHAAELSFVHPGTGEQVVFHSALPADLQQALAQVS